LEYDLKCFEEKQLETIKKEVSKREVA